MPNTAAPPRSRRSNGGDPATENRGNSGRQQHPSREVLLIRNLQGEDHPCGGGLEDRGHPGGGPGNQQYLRILTREHAAEAALEARPDRCAEVNRRSLVSHGPSQPKGGDAGQQTTGHGTEVHPCAGLMEVADVFVGGRGRRCPCHPAQQRGGEDQANHRRPDLNGAGLPAEMVEQLVTGNPIEGGDAKAGQRPRQR
jgi:hypothetical protein